MQANAMILWWPTCIIRSVDTEDPQAHDRLSARSYPERVFCPAEATLIRINKLRSGEVVGNHDSWGATTFLSQLEASNLLTAAPAVPLARIRNIPRVLAFL